MTTALDLASQFAPLVGVVALCAALSVPRATFYRRRSPRLALPARRSSPPRTLSLAERAEVLAVLHDERFVDQAPGEVYATLLDEGRYLCSERTMYRILADHDEVRERRRQRRHPVYTKPELVADRPNMVWSWDITKLRGPVKMRHLNLYVMLDIFSRYVVGWLVAEVESASLAQRLIEECCTRQNIVPGQLTIHADNGTPMIAKSTAQLLGHLGIVHSQSRPHVSDDNPFSEAHFKTLKYRPDFPDRFGGVDDAVAHCRRFFDWYGHDHHHSGIGWLTPADVHYGRAASRTEARGAVLEAANRAHPERFVRGAPKPPQPPTAVWINPPARISLDAARKALLPAIHAQSPEGAAESRVTSDAERSELAPDAAAASGQPEATTST